MQPAAPPRGQAMLGSDRLVHELANLVDGSLRNVGLALKRVGGNDATVAEQQAASHLETASQALRYMARLIEAHRQGRSGSLNAGFESDAPLGRVLHHAIRMVQPVATEQRIDLHVDLGDGVAELPLGSLYPVIVNLLRNALEAVEREGTITIGGAIETLDEGKGLVLAVEDDGLGIATTLPRDADGIVVPGVTTKTNGSGLGLSISRELVGMLGGRLFLEDCLPHGTRAVIRLPLIQRTHVPEPHQRGVGQ